MNKSAQHISCMVSKRFRWSFVNINVFELIDQKQNLLKYLQLSYIYTVEGLYIYKHERIKFKS